MKLKLLILFVTLFLFSNTAQTLSKETVIIETVFGTMKLKLYEETPLHKANFLKLAESGFYDSLLFHRVIPGFMIQGGDPLSKYAKKGDSLGHGDLKYTIPAEINPKLFHAKGKMCAARESDNINPKFESSASQFYIVMGKKRTLEDLKKYEDRINKTHYTNCAVDFIKSQNGSELRKVYTRLKSENKTDSAELVNQKIELEIKKLHLAVPEYKFSQAQIDVYTTIGGTPHLDGTYTVFGEVIEGYEIIDKIANAPKDNRDRPFDDIRIKITVKKR